MTPEQIAEWARMAGYDTEGGITMPHYHSDGPADETAFLARFAELVAAHERERMAATAAQQPDAPQAPQA